MVEGGFGDTIASINARQGERLEMGGRGSYKGDSRVDVVIEGRECW